MTNENNRTTFLNVFVHYEIEANGNATISDKKEFTNNSNEEVNLTNKLTQYIKSGSSEPKVQDGNDQQMKVSTDKDKNTYTVRYINEDYYVIPKNGSRKLVIEYTTENFLKSISRGSVEIDVSSLSYGISEEIKKYFDTFNASITINCKSSLRGIKKIFYHEDVFLIACYSSDRHDANYSKGLYSITTKTQVISSKNRGEFCVYRIKHKNTIWQIMTNILVGLVIAFFSFALPKII